MTEDDFKDEDGDYEVVDHADVDKYDGIGPGPDSNVRELDAFGAPIQGKPVKVRDGVRDSRSR